jgi:hypothetical protein
VLVRRFNPFSFLACALLTSAPLYAQDFGKTWIDRVTHELIEEEAPFNPHPVEWVFTAGELYTYDSNIFLTHTGRTEDHIFTTFLDGNVKSSSDSVDVEADLLVNYNAYVLTDNVSADEERFFGRVRYQGGELQLSLAEIARREVSPTDAVFTSRVPRFISDTSPFAAWKATDVFSFEVGSTLEVVDYLRSAFSGADNVNTRTTLTAAYTVAPKEVELLVQAGYWQVTYTDPAGPPDADGFIARGGIRGELTPKFYAALLAGYSSANTKDAGTNQEMRMGSPDVEVHLSYTPNPTSTWFADYSRRMGFSGDGASYQVVDNADLIGEWNLRDDLKLQARGEYSHVQVPAPVSLRRAYYSFGTGIEAKILPHLTLGAAVTYRWGVAPGTGNTGDFGDFLASVGADLLF